MSKRLQEVVGKMSFKMLSVFQEIPGTEKSQIMYVMPIEKSQIVWDALDWIVENGKIIFKIELIENENIAVHLK